MGGPPPPAKKKRRRGGGGGGGGGEGAARPSPPPPPPPLPRATPRQRAAAPRVWQQMLRQLLPFLLLVGLLATLVAAPAWADIAYKAAIKLEGLDDSTLLDTLKAAAQLVHPEDKPPPSHAR